MASICTIIHKLQKPKHEFGLNFPLVLMKRSGSYLHITGEGQSGWGLARAVVIGYLHGRKRVVDSRTRSSPNDGHPFGFI